jgi:hypothetical protein
MNAGLFDFSDKVIRVFFLWEMAKQLAGSALFAPQMPQLTVL